MAERRAIQRNIAIWSGDGWEMLVGNMAATARTGLRTMGGTLVTSGTHAPRIDTGMDSLVSGSVHNGDIGINSAWVSAVHVEEGRYLRAHLADYDNGDIRLNWVAVGN